jgi:Ca-activated chloride channel family protein
VVFVLDRSGSMGGWKMVAARRALARMVDTLTDRDRFTVYAFDNAIDTPPEFRGKSLVPATDRNRFRAVEFLAKVEARGGTEMAQPLDLAVKELSAGASDHERILVLITDGQVGNEDQILRNLGSRIRAMRIFTLGIDQAVNEGFLKRLAALGGGSCELVESENRLDEVMDHMHRQIGTPLLTGLRLEPAVFQIEADTLVPDRQLDLFTGAPLCILGRYRGNPGAIFLQARDDTGQPWCQTVKAVVSNQSSIASMWARGQVRQLEDRFVIGQVDRAQLEKRIVTTSLRHGVLCRFTAFVAVDRDEVVNAGRLVHQVTQPVEVPAGWVGAAPGMVAPAPMAPAPTASPKIMRSGAADRNSAQAALPPCTLGDEPFQTQCLPDDPPSTGLPCRQVMKEMLEDGDFEMALDDTAITQELVSPENEDFERYRWNVPACASKRRRGILETIWTLLLLPFWLLARGIVVVGSLLRKMVGASKQPAAPRLESRAAGVTEGPGRTGPTAAPEHSSKRPQDFWK